MLVNGRILTAESGLGIPHLIVVAFDFEDFRESQPPIATAERLGSTATNERGEFTLEFSRRAFARNDPEGRPDLTVAIYPPVVAGADRDWNRPIFTVPGARVNAGESEAFVIYLPAALLQQHGVPVSAGPRQETEASDAPASLARAIAMRQQSLNAFQAALTPAIRRTLQQHRATAQRVRQLAAGRPRYRGPSPFFVAPGEEAEPIIRQARERGLALLANAKPRGMTLRLTADELASLGVDEAAARPVRLLSPPT